MRRKNILVSAYFAKNVGDDLFLKVLFERYTHVNWYLLTADKSYKKTFKDYPHVNTVWFYREFQTINMFISWCKLTGHIEKYDAFVMIGGSLFMQEGRWEDVYTSRHKLLCLLSRHKIPSFIIGANFGPYKDEHFIDMYRIHFALYSHISFRDQYSLDLFKELDHVTVAADAVLSLRLLQGKPDERCIGISPIFLQNRPHLKKYSSTYYESLANLICHYARNDYKIKLFSFCYFEGDLESIKHILADVPLKYKKYVKIVEYEGDLPSFLDEFSQCASIIGTRFHSIILAIKYNQRFLPLIYSDKIGRALPYIKGIPIKDIHNIQIEKIDNFFNESCYDGLVKEAERQFSGLDQILTKNARFI